MAQWRGVQFEFRDLRSLFGHQLDVAANVSTAAGQVGHQRGFQLIVVDRCRFLLLLFGVSLGLAAHRPHHIAALWARSTGGEDEGGWQSAQLTDEGGGAGVTVVAGSERVWIDPELGR